MGWGGLAGLLQRLIPLGMMVLLTLAAPADTASDEPAAEAEAEEAIRHADAGDGPALAALAETGSLDVWVIADELLAMDRPDVARALAEVIRSPEDRTALLRQLAREPASELGGRRAAFAAAVAAPDERAAERVRSLAAWLPPSRLEADLVTILDGRIAYLLADAAPQAFEDPTAVQAAFRLGMRVARRIGWSLLELRLAGELAAWAQDRGAIAEVRIDLDAVLPLTRGRERWEDVADVLRAYGALLLEAGEGEAAAGFLRDATRVYARIDSPAEEARTLSILGSALLERGSVADALEVQLRAAALAEQAVVPDPDLSIGIQIATAGVYESLGMLSEAEGLLGGLLARLNAAPAVDPWVLAVVLGNVGRVRFLAGEVGQARLDLEACEQRFRALGSVGQALDALALQGWCDAAAEVVPATRARLEQALASSDDSVPALQRSNLAEALARCYLREDRAADAVATLKPIVESLRELEAGHTQHVDVPGEYGTALVAAGRPAEALHWIDLHVNGLLANVDGLEVASARTYRGIVAAEALAAGIRAAGELKDTDRLWFYMESARAIRLLASLGGRSRVEEAVLPDDLRRQLQEASQAVLAARQELARAAGAPGLTRADLPARRAARDVAEQQRDAVAQRVKIARQLADLGELARGARLTALASLRRALQPHEVVVSLSGTLPGDRVQALVVTRDGASSPRVLPGRAAMAAATLALRHWQESASPAEPPPEPRPPIIPLSEHLERLRGLLAPLQLPATATRVLVVPDAELAYIPFAALWPERDVALLPCGSLLDRLRPFISRRSGTRALALAVSDYSAPGLLAADPTLFAMNTMVAARGGSLLLPPLRFAAEEAKSVAGRDGLLLLNADVTSARLLELLARPDAPVWTTIHFACHGLVNADHPRLSGLALIDGVLTAQEIFPLRLKTDMVVLSACDTATDPYVMGEGLSGLVRSFLQADAPRVIASLWKVPDEPTAALMAHFYGQLRADPELSPATALRRAQAKIRETWPSPENWAAWTLWGAP